MLAMHDHLQSFARFIMRTSTDDVSLMRMQMYFRIGGENPIDVLESEVLTPFRHHPGSQCETAESKLILLISSYLSMHVNVSCLNVARLILSTVLWLTATLSAVYAGRVTEWRCDSIICIRPCLCTPFYIAEWSTFSCANRQHCKMEG